MDNNGFLDFKEFLLAMDLVAARTVEEKLLWCFKLYDTDNSGVIDKQEMGIIMEVDSYNVTSVTIITSCVPAVRVQHAGGCQRQAQG